MNKLIYGSIKMEPDSKSTKEASHHHIITRSLKAMYFCDGIIGKITNNPRHSYLCYDFDIIFVKMWENSILYWKILSIMRELMHTIKALQPDVLPKSDYLPIYGAFKSSPAFLGNKTPQKQAGATLKKSKTQASSSGDPNTMWQTHKGASTLYAITKADTFSVNAIQQYDSNPGQITLNKEIRTMHEWQYSTHLDYMCSLVAV